MLCAENKPHFILDFLLCRLSASHVTKVGHNFKWQKPGEAAKCSEARIESYRLLPGFEAESL